MDYEKSFITYEKGMNILVPKNLVSDEVSFALNENATKTMVVPSGYRFYALSFYTVRPVYWTTVPGTDLSVPGPDRHFFEGGGRWATVSSESKATLQFRPTQGTGPAFTVYAMVA